MVSCLEETLRVLKTTKQRNFDSWTSLLAEIEETWPDDIQKLILVYDSFLLEFPLCHGYWRNYAYQMLRLCTINKAVEVYERAVLAAAYSVDLWSNYCTFAMQSYEGSDDVRRLFERGLSFIGKDYRSHILLDKYIEFEYCQKQWSRLAHIYIRALRFPSKKLHHYYESFKKLITLWEEEIKGEGSDWLPFGVDLTCEPLKSGSWTDSAISKIIGDIVDHPVDLVDPRTLKTYQTVGEVLYNKSNQLDKNIGSFESAIRRSYFHAKPLDDSQLENWHQYLNFVEAQGDFDWTVKLYERCLIPCANYREFWIRYVDHMEVKGGREIANLVIERASTTFLKGDCTFHLYVARYKERTGDKLGARAAFSACKSDLSLDIDNIYREANMEKRMGNMEEALSIYERAILLAEETHNLEVLSLLYSRLARFTYLVSGSIDAAKEVFLKGFQKLPQNQFFIKAFIEFMITHGGRSQIPFVADICDKAIGSNLDSSQALTFDDREAVSCFFLEFVDLYGTVHEVEKAWLHHMKLFPPIGRPVSLDVITEKSISEKIKESNVVILSGSTGIQKSDPLDETDTIEEKDLDEDNRKSFTTKVPELCSALPAPAFERNQVNKIANMISDKFINIDKETKTLSPDDIQSASFQNLSINSSDGNSRRYDASNPTISYPQLVPSNPETISSDTQNEVSNLSKSEHTDRHLEVLTETYHFRERDCDQVCTTAGSDPVQSPSTTTKKIKGAPIESDFHFNNESKHEPCLGNNESRMLCDKETSTNFFLVEPAKCETQAVPSHLLYLHKNGSEVHGQRSRLSQQDGQGKIQHQVQDQNQQKMPNFPLCNNGVPVYSFQNLVPQSFVSAYPSQAINPMDSQSQRQDQLPFQGFPQYDYSFNGQDYSPNMWYYYQQQLYYMQLQQQNIKLQLQLANNPRQQICQSHFQLQSHGQELSAHPKKEQLHQQTSDSQQIQQQQQLQQDFHHGHHLEIAQHQMQNHHNIVHPQYQKPPEPQNHLQYHHLQQILQQQQLLQQQLMQQQQQLILQQQLKPNPQDYQVHQKSSQDQTATQQQQQLGQNQLPITPEQIQALSNYYIQNQAQNSGSNHLGQEAGQQVAAPKVPESLGKGQTE